MSAQSGHFFCKIRALFSFPSFSYVPDKKLSLKRGFDGYGHGFGGCNGLGGLGGFNGLSGFGGFDGISGFDGFGGFVF